jgi:hypothetical protein
MIQKKFIVTWYKQMKKTENWGISEVGNCFAIPLNRAGWCRNAVDW